MAGRLHDFMEKHRKGLACAVIGLGVAFSAGGAQAQSAAVQTQAVHAGQQKAQASPVLTFHQKSGAYMAATHVMDGGHGKVFVTMPSDRDPKTGMKAPRGDLSLPDLMRITPESVGKLGPEDLVRLDNMKQNTALATHQSLKKVNEELSRPGASLGRMYAEIGMRSGFAACILPEHRSEAAMQATAEAERQRKQAPSAAKPQEDRRQAASLDLGHFRSTPPVNYDGTQMIFDAGHKAFQKRQSLTQESAAPGAGR